jgi:hypothetical protein
VIAGAQPELGAKGHEELLTFAGGNERADDREQDPEEAREARYRRGIA